MKYGSFDSQVKKVNGHAIGRYQKSIFSAAVVGGIVVELWKVNVVATQIADIEVDCCKGLWCREPSSTLFPEARV